MLRIVNGPLFSARRQTRSHLVRTVNAYIRVSFLPASVAAVKNAIRDIMLQAICTLLAAMRERTLVGLTSWQPSSVKTLMAWAERLELID